MNEILKEGLDITQQKKDASAQMNDIAKNNADVIGLDKKQIMAIKDYTHYRGRGWGSDALDKSEEKEKFPDRVTPTFRRLVEIVSNLRDADMLEFLDAYLEACERRGIKITIEAERTAVQDTVDKSKLSNVLEEMNDLQCTICELNDRITDELAPAAQEEGFTPKSKFKNVVEHAYQILNKNKEKAEEKIEKQINDNDMYTNALDEVKQEA